MGCRLWGRTESGTTEATQEQQQQQQQCRESRSLKGIVSMAGPRPSLISWSLWAARLGFVVLGTPREKPAPSAGS